MKKDIFGNPRIVDAIYGVEYNPFFDIEKFGIKNEDFFKPYFSEGLHLIGSQNKDNITSPRIVLRNRNAIALEMAPIGSILRFPLARVPIHDAIKEVKKYVKEVFCFLERANLFKFNGINGLINVQLPLVNTGYDLSKDFLSDFFSIKIPSDCIGSSLSYAVKVGDFKLDTVINQYEAREQKFADNIKNHPNLNSKFTNNKDVFIKMDVDEMTLIEKGLGYIVRINGKKLDNGKIDGLFISESLRLLEDAISKKMESLLF